MKAKISIEGTPKFKNTIGVKKIVTSPPKTLIVFVSVIYNNNFSIKYIHLKSHFSGRIDYEVYNRPIGWRILIFLSLVSLLVSHNVGSHTAPCKVISKHTM